MKQIIQKTIIASVLAALITVPAVSFAHDGVDHSNPATTSEKRSEMAEQLRQKLDEQKQAMQEKMSSVKTEAKQRLDDSKKRICEKHQSTINNVIKNMGTRRQNTFDRIMKVSDAVQKFYSDKQLTSDNYTNLLEVVNDAKVAAQSSMTEQQSLPSIDCNGDHPKSDVADFRQKREVSVDAMRTYRDAVKQLTTTVKQAAQTTKGDAA